MPLSSVLRKLTVKLFKHFVCECFKHFTATFFSYTPRDCSDNTILVEAGFSQYRLKNFLHKELLIYSNTCEKSFKTEKIYFSCFTAVLKLVLFFFIGRDMFDAAIIATLSIFDNMALLKLSCQISATAKRRMRRCVKVKSVLCLNKQNKVNATFLTHSG